VEVVKGLAIFPSKKGLAIFIRELKVSSILDVFNWYGPKSQLPATSSNLHIILFHDFDLVWLCVPMLFSLYFQEA